MSHKKAHKSQKLFFERETLIKLILCLVCLFVANSFCAFFAALFTEPADGSTREIDPNALDLRVKLERVPAHLAPVTRLLVTTKGRRCIEHVEGIDPDHARFDLFRETMRAGDVPGPNPGR